MVKDKIIVKPIQEKEDTNNERREKLYNIARHIPKSFLDVMEYNIAKRGIMNLCENTDKIKIKRISEIDRFENKLNKIIVDNMRTYLERLKEKTNIKINNDIEDLDYDKVTKRSRSKGFRQKKTNLNPDKKNNLFSPNNLVSSNEEIIMNNFIKETYSPINIANINRPFSIILKNIRLNKHLSSSYEDNNLLFIEITVTSC